MNEDERYQSFREFYPYYLTEHQLSSTRRLHFFGTGLALVFLFIAIITFNAWWLLVGLFCGYLFAWIGHFFFEKNKPATFKYPLWSLLGDFKLFFQILMGKEKM